RCVWPPPRGIRRSASSTPDPTASIGNHPTRQRRSVALAQSTGLQVQRCETAEDACFGISLCRLVAQVDDECHARPAHVLDDVCVRGDERARMLIDVDTTQEGTLAWQRQHAE